MTQDISITLVKNDDDLLAIALLKRADDSECTGNKISEDLALEKIMRIRDGGSDFWIARDGQNPVGYALGILEGESYESYRSQGIYVVSDYRGRGIGTALKQAQIAFARDLGCDEIWSNIADANKASKRVQEKTGFSFEPNAGGYIVRLPLRV